MSHMNVQMLDTHTHTHRTHTYIYIYIYIKHILAVVNLLTFLKSVQQVTDLELFSLKMNPYSFQT